ncbi:hydrophobin [Atractiella rhizophila]|nr:hydrophobin [Atractiella rhizophila]
MQLLVLVSSFLVATLVAASPSRLDKKDCDGAPHYECAHGVPQCCAVDVLGVADLDCHSPHDSPTSKANFQQTCSKVGQQAKCCTLPVAGQAVLCHDP